jgi:hypothetical protein
MAPPLDLESQLNSEQLPAVTHGDGPQLVLAGAGSGKTRVITYRVAWLVREQKVDPADIVAVTFTNKAATEMRERVEKLIELYPLPTFVGTFHRYALRLLRRYGERVGVQPGFAIFDRADQLSLVKKALAEEGLAEGAYEPRKMLAAIGRAKNSLLDPEMYESQASGFYEQKVAQVYRRYQGKLVQASGVDFDDMLRLAVKLLSSESIVGIRGSWCRPRVSTSTTCCGWRSSFSPRRRLFATACASALAICWWTSFKIPTMPRCGWYRSLPAKRGTSRQWATRIRGFTAGGERTWTMCSISSRLFRGRWCASSSATIARLRTS